MRAHNTLLIIFTLLSIVILATFAQAEQKNVQITFKVISSEYPFSPVNGATVEVSRLDTSETWELTTGADGKTTGTAETTLEVGQYYYFQISIAKSGFESRVTEQRVIFYGPDSSSKTITLNLNPISTADPACDDNEDNDGDGKCDFDGSVVSDECDGTPDPGCTSATDNDETDPYTPSTSGVVVDAKIISGSSGVSCQDELSPDHVEKGSWSPPGSGGIYKLCTKHIPEADYSGTNTIVEMARLRKVEGEAPYCNQDEGEIDGRLFTSGGAQAMIFCYKEESVDETDLITSQRVYDIIIQQGGCPIAYQVVSEPFLDENGDSFYMCTALNGYTPAHQGDCTLSEPKWVKDYPDEGILEITPERQPINGWVSDPGYQRVETGVFMRVKATGCENDEIKIELWEGDPTEQNDIFRKVSPEQSKLLIDTIPAGDRLGEYASLSWSNTGWYEKTGVLGLDPQSNRKYYFKAKVSTTPPVESPLSAKLEVTKPPRAECQWTNTESDYTSCPDGKVCVEGNVCQDFSCLGNPNLCTDGLFCDEEEGSDTEGQCIECYEDTDCTESPAYGEFAEYYFCNMSSDSDNYRMCDSDECIFETLEFRNQRNNVIDEANGWVVDENGRYNENDYIWGTEVKLFGKATGCEDVTDMRFVIVEEDNIIGIVTDEIVQKLTPDGELGNQYFIFTGWKPPWYIDEEHLFSLISGKNEFEYHFYAASASDLETPLGLERSATLIVHQPDEAECDPNYNPNDPDNDPDEDIPTCGEGLRCVDGNRCVAQCRPDQDPTGCEDNLLCADGTIEGATEGSCYECFNNTHCIDVTDKPRCQVNITKDSAFSCVQCMNNTDCPEVNDNPGICAEDNTCTVTCNPDNGNADCSSFALPYLNEDELLQIRDLTERASKKGKDVCHPENRICVQCTSNYGPDDPDSCDPDEICCPIGTACLTEESRCVECIEDSICGPFSVCDKDNNVCIGRGLGQGGLFGEGFGGVAIALIGAAAGFFIGGPMGAAIGGIAGLLLGGGLGGEGGGFLGGIGDLIGGFLTYLSTLM